MLANKQFNKLSSLLASLLVRMLVSKKVCLFGGKIMNIAFTNSKGGVGKSTLAVHFTAWCHDHRKLVALVDADAQGSSSVWLQEAAPKIPIFRLQTPDEVLERVPELFQQFDFLVIDGPAGLSEVTRAIMLVADLAILPCGPSVLDLRAANEAIRVVRQAQSIRHGPPNVLLVPNKLQVQLRLSREFIETAKELSVPMTVGLRLRQAYADAAGQGKLVWQLRGAKKAADEMQSVFIGVWNGSKTNPVPSAANV